MEQVHFMMRSISEPAGVIYPSEEETTDYYGFGGFYLIGSEDYPVAEEYSFLAVQGEELVRTVAHRYRDTKNFFQVEVEKVGTFLFHAQSMPKKYPYVGNNPDLKGKFAFRRMRSWKPTTLENACKEHGFYFVGVAKNNIIETQ